MKSDHDKDSAYQFLMRYAELRKQQNKDDQKYHDLRNALIRDRIQQPVTEFAAEDLHVHKISPAHGPKPSKIGLSVGSALGLDLTLYRRDPLNEATDLGMSFQALDIRYQWHEQRDLYDIDILSARKLTDLSERLYEDQTWSWGFKTGIRNDDFDLDARKHFAQGEIGFSYAFGQHSMAYHLFAGTVHDQDHYIDLKTITGILYKSDLISAQLEYENIYRDAQHTDQWSLVLRKKLEKNADLRFEWSQLANYQALALVGLNFYW